MDKLGFVLGYMDKGAADEGRVEIPRTNTLKQIPATMKQISDSADARGAKNRAALKKTLNKAMRSRDETNQGLNMMADENRENLVGLGKDVAGAVGSQAKATAKKIGNMPVKKAVRGVVNLSTAPARAAGRVGKNLGGRFSRAFKAFRGK